MKETKGRSFWKKDGPFLFIAVCLNLVLNLFAFNWGMDGYVPWSPDSIEGITVLREMPKLYGKWDYKYPRLQFLIDGTIYKVFINGWERKPEPVTFNGQTRAQVITPSRLETLARISRVNVLIMSALTVVFIYLAGRFYYSSSWAGFIAAVCTALTYGFVYYSHTTCVDVPSMLWITAGFYFMLRSTALNKWKDHVAMGAMFAFACATKDPVLFYAAAFAVAYTGLRLQKLYASSRNWKTSLRGLASRNTLLAIAVFGFLFALLQNIIPWPMAYWERMGVWVGGRGVKDFNQEFAGYLPQLVGTLRQFYCAIGWPLIAMIVVSLAVTMRKHLLFNTLAIVFPLVFFYVAVSMQIKMSYIRYYLPIMGLFYLPVGFAAAQVWQQRSRLWSRAALGAGAAGLICSALYCAALVFELARDSRTRTAEWFVQNVSRETPVLSCIRRPYGPKLNRYGYKVIENWSVPSLQQMLAEQNKLPPYIITSDEWLNLQTPEALGLRKALASNQMQYERSAAFRHTRVLNPKKNWMSLACWPIMPAEGVSPEIQVWKKN
ncbi:MAG: glycosyltransferase family 39 protein [Planctomycetaceae bacterium]|nr:glycosyltransferase family 39 protein [Planctomycetaceae bacterium]